MSQIISVRFDVGDDANWNAQTLDTTTSISGGGWFAEITRPLPVGYRFLCVSHAKIRAYPSYASDYSPSAGDYQDGVWSQSPPNSDPALFTVRFIFPVVSGSLGPFIGWFEASFVKD